MITFRITAEVGDDRRVALTLPSEVPIGAAELSVTVEPHGGAREEQRTLALERLLALARGSSFRAAGPYPTRHELHERH